MTTPPGHENDSPPPLPSLPRAVVVRQPTAHSDEAIIVVRPHVAVIQADTRRAWGKILAHVAGAEPKLLTAQIASRSIPGFLVEDDERERALDATRHELFHHAHKEGYGILAIGPLEHDSRQEFPPSWTRRALVVPLVEGWDGAGFDGH